MVVQLEVPSPTLTLARIKDAWNGLGDALDAIRWDFPKP